MPHVVLPHVDQRVLLGELGERARGACAVVRGRTGTTTVSSVGGGELVRVAARRRLDRSRRRSGSSPRPQSFAICPACADGRCDRRPRSNTLIAVTFALLRAAVAENCSRSRVRIVPENSRTYAIFSPLGPRSILKTVPETGPSASPAGRGQQLGDAGHQRGDAAPVIAEPKNTGCTSARRRLRRELAAQPLGTRRSPRPRRTRPAAASSCSASTSTSRAGIAIVDAVRREDARPRVPELVAPSPSGRSPTSASRRCRPARARHCARRARSILLTKISVGMRSRCSARIRTRVCACTPSTAETHQHRAVEHAQHPFHLGDEVRVAGRVDQVDGDVADRERRRPRT